MELNKQASPSTNPIIRNWKHRLPSYYKLTCIKFDIPKILAEIKNYESHFANVLESNKALCLNNPQLVQSVYEHYEQISLTEFSGKQKDLCSVEHCVEKAENAGTSAPLSKRQQYKIKLSERFDVPEMDERNYNAPTKLYTNSYIQSCVETFTSQPMRVRIVKLKAGKKVDWHIDYDPSFAVRIILPLVTHPLVINKTKRKNIIEECFMPADGHPWFLNTGFAHYVENKSDIDRIILMFSLNPDSLLEKMSRSWLAGSTSLESMA